MIDVQAGALIANPTPMKNTQPRMRQGLRRRSQPSTAKVKVVVAKQTLTVHTSLWRSTLSARTPAGSVNRNKGRDGTVDINDSNNGGDAGQMTVNGELHKLAHNISFGHGIHAGIHWRSDTDTSIQLGEAIALSVLQDRAHTYNEKFTVKLTKLDGSSTTITNQ